MKLYQFAAVTAATLVLTACGGDKAPETEAAETASPAVEEVSPLASLDQRLSYIVGENMAAQFTRDGITLDTDSLALAVADVVAGNEPRLSEEDKRNTITEIQARSQAKQKVSIIIVSWKAQKPLFVFSARSMTILKMTIRRSL